MATNKRVLLKKDELVGAVAEAASESKATVGKVLDTNAQVVVETIVKNPPKGDEVVTIPIVGIGTLGVKNVAEKKIRNNITGKDQVVPAHRGVAIKVSKSFKTALNPEEVKKVAAAAKKDSKKKGA